MMQTAGARTDRPRFRQDLVAELIDEQGTRFIDVMDPDSGSLFRFYEVEYSLACGMDGERDVSDIVRWAQDELGLTPSQHEVRAVIATLGDLGFIDARVVDPAAPELVPGGVTLQTPAPAVEDVELGAPGARPAAAAASVPAAPPVALGAPGASPTGRRPAEPAPDVSLGAAGRSPARPTPAPSDVSSEVSLDLSDHIAVRPDDVKEAVRASKVMSAVEVPQDLLDALEDRPVTKPPVSRPPESRPPEASRSSERIELRADAKLEPRPEQSRPPEPVRPEPRTEARSEPAAAEAPASQPPFTRMPEHRPGKPAVELPKAPPPADKAAVAPPAPSRGVSPALIVVLILVVLGAIAFAVWKLVLDKPVADTETSSAPVAPPVKPAEPPPPPPAPTSKIAMTTAAAEDVKVGRAGVIETIQADKFTASAGDVLVRLVGDRPLEAELTGIAHDAKKLQDAIDAATKRRDAAQAAGNKADEAKATTEIADRQKTLTTKQSQLDAKRTEIDNFVIHAASNGTFTPSVKQGQKVTADALIGTLQRDAVPVATFAITDGKPFSVDASVDVTVGKAGPNVVCKVAEVQPTSLKVTCPADPALTDGADVTLKSTAADAPGTPPAAGSSGSDAGGSAAAGSSEPATGSAAAPETK
jgi:hypothetical protein